MDTPWIPMSGGDSRKRGVTGDLFNAIPPAYTKFIGEQFKERLMWQDSNYTKTEKIGGGSSF